MQKVIKWECSRDYIGHHELPTKLEELIQKGYRIINVIPTQYRGSGTSFIEKAIIIVDEGRKEKLDKINSI